MGTVTNKEWGEQEKRFCAILGDKLEVSKNSLKLYEQFLRKNIELPCILTGSEDFPWEEKYLFGFGLPGEYEKLKKSNPSYTDIFELNGYAGTNDRWGVIAKVIRKSDGKKFEVALDFLKVIDKKSENYRLVIDYAVWFANY